MTLAEEIREKLNTNSTDIVRAVIYARVSTDNEGQKESCSNQVSLAKGYLTNHPNINLVATYVDDGISGKNDFTRPQYNEMLQKLSDGGFDLILTKSLSRLNRNELNSLILNNLLIEHNATVLTLEDNQIHDFEDVNSELLHTIKYAIDAQYVKQQSINGRKTQELRCEKKELTAKDCCFGYTWRKDDKIITINEPQADVVRMIFEDYVYHNATPNMIVDKIKEQGVNLSSRTITNMILNEKYIGKFYINKKTTKLGTGQTKSKRISIPKNKWVLIERPDLQIVDTDLFNMAKRVHDNRISIHNKPDKEATQARFRGKHLFASKVFCPICGQPYRYDYADRKKTIPIYRIGNHRKCPNKINRIYEADLEEITRITLKQVVEQQEEVCTSLENILTEVVKASQNSSADIDRLKKQKSSREKQLDNLIDQLSEGGLTEAAKNRIKTKINTITEETDRLTETINDKENNKLDDSYVTEKLASIRAAIVDLRNFTSIDRDRILNYIERIEMPPNGDIEITLKSGQVIVAKQQNNRDFFDGNSVGKKGRRGTTEA